MANNNHMIMTRSGVFFDVMDPQVDNINIDDIAHALSNLCRFGGHSNEFYSVAQHSVICALCVSEPFKRHALLHDASEAYLVDIPRPIKSIFPKYKRIEKNLQNFIFRRFDLNKDIPEEVHIVDRRLCISEAHELGLMPEKWSGCEYLKPININLSPMKPHEAKEAFLREFKSLFN